MKKLIALLLCFVLTFSFPASTSVWAMDVSAEVSNGIPVKTEVVSKRDTYSKTYQLPDGRYEYVGYAEPVHYKTGDGSFYEINNEITETTNRNRYAYTNTANAWNAYFANKLSAENAVLITDGNHTISFSFPNQTSLSAVTKTCDSSAKQFSAYHQKLAADNRAVIYNNVANNVDIAYTVLTGALKEDIILKAKGTPNSFVFRLNTNGLILKESRSSFALVTASNEEVFAFAPLYMEDANGKRSEKVSLSFSSVKNGYEITITAEPAFLNAADTAYPVVIDPSIIVSGSDVTQDTCVDQQYPNSNYYLSENLWTGGAWGTNAMRTYIKFTMPSSIPASQVTSAYINLLKKEHQVPTIKAYRVDRDWNSSSVTWNSQPSYAYDDCSAVASNVGGDWYRLYITSMVTDWLWGTYANYGVMLMEPSENNSEQKTKFYSSDASAPNKPELHIFYTVSTPQITYYYDLYRNTSMTTEALPYVMQASADIFNMYNVRFEKNMSVASSLLNQRAGCTYGANQICGTSCGLNIFCKSQHHKSAAHFIECEGQSSPRKVFSFVEFPICYHTLLDGHEGIIGLAAGDNSRMLVSLTSYNVQRTTCHEMSHLIGARDEVCTSSQCVMKYGSDVTNKWCSQCQSDIKAYLESIS